MPHETLNHVDLTDYRQAGCMFEGHKEVELAIAKHFASVAMNDLDWADGVTVDHVRQRVAELVMFEMDETAKRICRQIKNVGMKNTVKLDFNS